jgi:predicted transposase YbfD/YdcC
MNEGLNSSLTEAFETLSDRRVEGRCEHKLVEIVLMAVCAMLTGAESWVEVETFGQLKEEKLRDFMELAGGIPSHDTFGRVFAALDAEEFQGCFARWVEGVFHVSKGQVIAIDGKTVRGSHNRGIGKAAIHMVSAWATSAGIALGQCKVDDKSNEITAIPELLRALDVSECIITIDAIGCQKKIAQTIRDEKAEYVLRVKENQGNLHQDIADWFAYADQTAFANMNSTYSETVNKGHGRIDIRRCWAIADELAFEHIRHYDGWADLRTIVRIQRERRLADKTETETAYYISSLPNIAQQLLTVTRAHWAIENSFHWVLDVTFAEDASRIRVGNAPQNMAVLRHLALNILKADKSKGSLRNKRYKAALDDSFLFSLLANF